MSAFNEDNKFDPFGDLEDDGSEAAYGDLSRNYGDGFGGYYDPDEETDEKDVDG